MLKTFWFSDFVRFDSVKSAAPPNKKGIVFDNIPIAKLEAFLVAISSFELHILVFNFLKSKNALFGILVFK